VVAARYMNSQPSNCESKMKGSPVHHPDTTCEWAPYALTKEPTKSEIFWYIQHHLGSTVSK